MTAHPTFPSTTQSDFLKAIRKETREYFESRSLSQKANSIMVVKALLMFALVFVPYGLILSGSLSVPWMAVLAVLVGFGMAGVGFSVGHDALHGAFSASPTLNRILGWSMDLVGGSSYFWRITHNVMHHTYTNIYGTDDDVGVSPLLRLSPHAPHRWFHRYQHIYAVVLYSLTTFHWAFTKDYNYLLGRSEDPHLGRRHELKNVLGLFAGKIVFYTWTIVIPFLVLPLVWWQIVLGILIAHVVAGTTLGLVFQLAHVVEETGHITPDETGLLPLVWAHHEMETTANFSQGNRLLGLCIGGLNHQIEHHLFPRVCSIHYPALGRIVRNLAADHGLPYHTHPSFGHALRSHFRILQRFGTAAA